MSKCWRCKGSGQIKHPHHVEEMVDCPTCGGTGKKIEPYERKQKCPECEKNSWIDNPIKGTTFCRNCGYVIADL